MVNTHTHRRAADRMRVSVIAAVGRNGVIGANGVLPWRLPGELAYFRRVTMGHHVIVGRRTYESLRGPLPGRTTVVLSRSPTTTFAGCVAATTLDDALSLARDRGESEVFVAGGAQVYADALPYADRAYITHVDLDVTGDAHFSPLDMREWREVLSNATVDGCVGVRYTRLERVSHGW